jgi:hypothetical protein
VRDPDLPAQQRDAVPGGPQRRHSLPVQARRLDVRSGGFSASFIANGITAPPAIRHAAARSGLPRQRLVAQQDFLLPGLVGGGLDFASYLFNSTFNGLTEVDFIGYACNAAGSCNRTRIWAVRPRRHFRDFRGSRASTFALVGLALVGVGRDAPTSAISA